MKHPFWFWSRWSHPRNLLRVDKADAATLHARIFWEPSMLMNNKCCPNCHWESFAVITSHSFFCTTLQHTLSGWKVIKGGNLVWAKLAPCLVSLENLRTERAYDDPWCCRVLMKFEAGLPLRLLLLTTPTPTTTTTATATDYSHSYSYSYSHSYSYSYSHSYSYSYYYYYYYYYNNQRSQEPGCATGKSWDRTQCDSLVVRRNSSYKL